MRGMAAPAPWTFSNWISFGTGTAQRLSRLRSHIQEVSDRISQLQQYALKGREVGPPVAELRAYMDELFKKEELEADRVDISTGARLPFTQGFAKLSPGSVPGDEEGS